jgi:hypothetical protein
MIKPSDHHTLLAPRKMRNALRIIVQLSRCDGVEVVSYDSDGACDPRPADHVLWTIERMARRGVMSDAAVAAAALPR